METIELLSYIFELIAFLSGATAAIAIMKKNPHYIGNRIMAAAMLTMGLYSFFIFIYDIIKTAWAIQIFLRLAMIDVSVSVVLLYMGMQILIESSVWYTNKKNWSYYFYMLAVWSIYLIFADFITIQELGVVNTQIDILPLLIMVVGLIIMLIKTIKDLYKEGIKRYDGLLKKKLWVFEIGLIINLGAILVNIPSQLVSDPYIGSILDVLFFLVLAIGITVVSLGFLMPGKE